MGHIKDENFVNIQGWMLTKLHLKGNQLIVYAVIYGFSQDDESWFTCSCNYLAEWCGASRQTVISALNVQLGCFSFKEHNPFQYVFGNPKLAISFSQAVFASTGVSFSSYKVI